MNPSSSTTLLTQVVPWSVHDSPRTILIGDSVESDGRFLLHTVASQVLENNTRQGRVLWLSCGPLTVKLIATALKKIGCEAATNYLRTLESNQQQQSSLVSSLPLSIRSLTADMGKQLETDEDLNMEAFTKQVYREAKEWLQQQQASSSSTSTSTDSVAVPWIILDDVSALGALVGERLAYGLVVSFNALAVRTESFGLVVRYSQDLDQERSSGASTVAGASVEQRSRQPDWVGAGGKGQRQAQQQDCVPWERSLVEVADCLVDVTPLASGYTREAHGRLLFTAVAAGRGWGGDIKGRTATSSSANDATPLVFNYCLTDNKVHAIPIRANV